jgi:hypothetical protein
MSEENFSDASDNIDIEINDYSSKTPMNKDKNINENDILGSDESDFSRQTTEIDVEISEELKKEFLNLESEHEFNQHLQGKLDKLNKRLKRLQEKYYSYKKWYDRLNIMIIIISSILSVLEALRNEMFHITENNKTWTVIFNMIPLSISTFITGTAAIIQFQKYQEKMENMQFTKEKVILAISKLKHVQEIIWFSKPEDFEKVKGKYLHDIYMFYSESSSELERQLKSA